MNYIWSLKNLVRLCSHKEAIIREWAIERLTLIYPEDAGDAALKLIRNNDKYAAQTAADYFYDYPDKRYSDDLLALYKTASGIIAGKITGALAKLNDTRLINEFRKKYPPEKDIDLLTWPLSVLHIASFDSKEAKEIVTGSLKSISDENDFALSICATLFFANLRAGTDISELLNVCFEQPENVDLIIKLLTEIGSYCGSWHSEDDYREEESNDDMPHIISDSLAYIDSQGYGDITENLEALFKKRKYADLAEEISVAASALLDAGKKDHGEGTFDKWLKGTGKPRQNISAIYAFRDAVDDAPENFKRIIAKTALNVFARLIEYRGVIGLDIDRMNTDDMLKLFLQERGDIEEDERLMDRLMDTGADKNIIDRCLDHMRENPASWAASRIVSLLGNFKDAGIVSELLGLDNEYEEVLTETIYAVDQLEVETAIDVLKPVFEKFCEAGIPGSTDLNRINLALRVLEDIPSTAASDIIIKHWDSLLTADRETLLVTARGIGDRRFIELLRKEIKPGEVYEAEIFSLLCRINGVSDPLLKKAEQYIDRHNKKLARRAEIIEASDISGLMREPVKVELQCRSCKRLYHYDVEKIIIGSETRDQFIEDKITCKNCGSVDDYEISPKGAFSIMSHLMLLVTDNDIDKESLNDNTVVVGRMAPIDGKIMTVAESVAYYEERIKDNPKNPEYLVAHANTLRKAKRTGDAIPAYKEVLAVDPLAIEAYVSLGQIYEDNNDTRTAYEYYRRASAIMNSANYYRVKQDMDQFKEAVLDSLVYTGKKLGIKPSHIAAPAKTGSEESPVKFPAVGRNKPCPCGSGKKYKKCCLQKESGKKPPGIDLNEKDVMDRLMLYSMQDKFRKEFLEASAIYWRTEPVEPLVVPDTAFEDKGIFIEWYINDYLFPSGRTIIEEFYSEVFRTLNDEEKAILDAHIMSYMSLYEILDVTAGEGFRVKEVKTGREFKLSDIKGSQQLVKWDIIAARAYTLNSVTRIAGSVIQTVPRYMKDGLMAFLTGELENFRNETGEAEWSAFMKRRSYIIQHFLEDSVEEKKVFLTEEGYNILFATAIFGLEDIDDALYLLDEEYDFVIDEETKGEKAILTWLKRGKSKEWKRSNNRNEKGLMLQSKWIHESGQLEFSVLGNITITPGKLTLECTSRERLERGKQRLLEVLGDLVIHKIDTFEDVEKALEKSKAAGKQEKDFDLSESNKFILQEQLVRNINNWIDEKIPLLNGISPKEAVKTPEGKHKVAELIKDFENMEERRKSQGRPYLDLSVIKKELDL